MNSAKWNIGRSKPWTDNAEHRSCAMDYFYEKDGVETAIGCECSERKRIWGEAQAKYPTLNAFAALQKAADHTTPDSKKQLKRLFND